MKKASCLSPLSVVLLALASSSQLRAQAPADAAPVAQYDVVSVKVDKSESGNLRISSPADGFSATNIDLRTLLQNAYNLKLQSQLTGLPSWAGNARFDVDAKMDPETLAALKKLPRKEAFEQRLAMLQALLADRFQLKIHHETKEMPMYALVVSKSGSKLKEVDASAPQGTSVGPGMFKGNGIPLSSLAFSLGGFLNRQVVDRTGLTGRYDVVLQWAPEGAAAQDSAAGAGPSMLTALREETGLQLDPIRGPVDTIVVDHVEMPSSN